jgi:hypothetical protein
MRRHWQRLGQFHSLAASQFADDPIAGAMHPQEANSASIDAESPIGDTQLSGF